MHARRDLQKLEIHVVRHHRPLGVLLLGEPNPCEGVLPKQPPSCRRTLPCRPVECRYEHHQVEFDGAVPDWPARRHTPQSRVALAPRQRVAPHVRLGKRRHIARRPEEGDYALEAALIGSLRAGLLAQVLGAFQVELGQHADSERLLVQRLLVREQGVEELVGLSDRQFFVAVPQRLSDLLSVDINGPEQRAARAVFIQPHPGATLADGLRPAFPVLHNFLRSLAMSWASASGSYAGPEGVTSFARSPRRILWRPRGFARRSGMAPFRTARRMVSSQQPVSRAAWPASSSALV